MVYKVKYNLPLPFSDFPVHYFPLYPIIALQPCSLCTGSLFCLQHSWHRCGRDLLPCLFKDFTWNVTFLTRPSQADIASCPPEIHTPTPLRSVCGYLVRDHIIQPPCILQSLDVTHWVTVNWIWVGVMWYRPAISNLSGTRDLCSYENLMPDELKWSRGSDASAGEWLQV